MQLRAARGSLAFSVHGRLADRVRPSCPCGRTWIPSVARPHAAQAELPIEQWGGVLAKRPWAPAGSGPGSRPCGASRLVHVYSRPLTGSQTRLRGATVSGIRPGAPAAQSSTSSSGEVRPGLRDALYIFVPKGDGAEDRSVRMGEARPIALKDAGATGREPLCPAGDLSVRVAAEQSGFPKLRGQFAGVGPGAPRPRGALRAADGAHALAHVFGHQGSSGPGRRMRRRMRRRSLSGSSSGSDALSTPRTADAQQRSAPAPPTSPRRARASRSSGRSRPPPSRWSRSPPACTHAHTHRTKRRSSSPSLTATASKVPGVGCADRWPTPRPCSHTSRSFLGRRPAHRGWPLPAPLRCDRGRPAMIGPS